MFLLYFLILTLFSYCANATICPDSGTTLYFRDMHDGDMKMMNFTYSEKVDKMQITIEPYQNDESWIVKEFLNDYCTALVDFNVPGKPNPPPINLMLQLFDLASNYNPALPKTQVMVVFTDPTGTSQSCVKKIRFEGFCFHFFKSVTFMLCEKVQKIFHLLNRSVFRVLYSRLFRPSVISNS